MAVKPRSPENETPTVVIPNDETAVGGAVEMKNTVLVVKGTYATAYYRKNNIPHCHLCGAQYCHADGQPICPEGFSANHCPRIKGD
jgi:hypothetical protein